MTRTINCIAIFLLGIASSLIVYDYFQQRIYVENLAAKGCLPCERWSEGKVTPRGTWYKPVTFCDVSHTPSVPCPPYYELFGEKIFAAVSIILTSLYVIMRMRGKKITKVA